MERMPPGFRLTPKALVLPDGAEIEFFPLPPDEQFAGIFKSSCRRPPTDGELATVRRYTVNIGLSGPGGSMEAASTMMAAGAAIVRAGGAGVFIDNCGLSHGGGHWLEMADDSGPDALSFAFVSIVKGKDELRTLGMHVMGFPEFVMRESDADDQSIIEVIRYVCSGNKPIADGHLLGDEHGARFHVKSIANDPRTAGSPMHNPFGRLMLTSLKEIAEGN